MCQPGENGSFEVAIRSDPREARCVQDLIEQELREHQFEDRDIFSIKLALEEALVNAIKHGNQMDRSKKVRVKFAVNDQRIDIDIVDEGKGFEMEDVPDPMAPENLERPCGRGLLLMRAYMTDVTFHPPGNRLSMSKIREPLTSPLNGQSINGHLKKRNPNSKK